MVTPHSRTRVLWRLLISLVLIGAILPISPARIEAATPKPTLLGLATADFRTDIPDFTREAGRPPAFSQLFWSLESDWAGGGQFWVPPMLSELDALGVTPYVEITTNDLGGLNSGAKDNNLGAMAEMVGDWITAGANRHVLIAPLPEMNLLHPWGGDPGGFKSGYRRIRQAFLDQGMGPDQVRFVFAPNGTSDVGEYDDYYPGDATVDLIGFARINRGAPWLDYNATFQTHLDDLQARVSLSKPILITQTGSVTTNGDRDAWLNDMFTKLRTNSQVIGAIYFNRDKDHDYRVLVNGSLDPAFRSGYQNWSDPDEVSWIFDGRMDAWAAEREELYGSGFLDVHGHLFENSIRWLAGEGITQGCNPPLNTRFCPDDGVTRGEMAVFLARALNLPSPTGDHFLDDNGEFYEGAANRLYEAAITVGCGTRRYCGEQRISREQMAAFLARTLGLPGTNVDHFIDDGDSEFEGAINKIAEAGITAGCNPPANDRFCPDAEVSRGQMATFLHRALG